MTWSLGHEEWCFSIRRIMVCAQQSEKWFGAVLPVLLDLRAVSPTIIYGLYDIVSGASHPQIDLGSSWKATSSGEKMFNWFIWRRKQVLKPMRKHELFDHVIVVEESSRLGAYTFAMEIQSLAGWVSSIVPHERLVSKAVTLWHVQYCPHCLCVRWEHWKPHSRQQVA